MKILDWLRGKGDDDERDDASAPGDDEERPDEELPDGEDDPTTYPLW
jgi:hypothetical protein